MKITTGILVAGLMTGGLWAQNPNIINNVQSTMNTVQQAKTNDSNAALGISSTPSAKPAAKAPAGTQGKPAAAPASAKSAPASATVAAKPQTAPAVKKSNKSRTVIAAKETTAKPVAKVAKSDPFAGPKVPAAKPVEVSKSGEAPKPTKPEEKKWAMSGKRDPFFSPVVQQSSGSGCSTGKKCLEIGQINLRGVVKSENGFIAVVTNSVNKAYFLRENDPVFNGYVVKITGDAVVFQETVQDKLGKPLTREVTKRIFTPAV
jgi:Tfp pilus assembly protein PilP